MLLLCLVSAATDYGLERRSGKGSKGREAGEDVGESAGEDTGGSAEGSVGGTTLGEAERRVTGGKASQRVTLRRVRIM